MTPTETNIQRCFLFMVMTWARYKTREALLNSGERLVVFGSWQLAGGLRTFR